MDAKERPGTSPSPSPGFPTPTSGAGSSTQTTDRERTTADLLGGGGKAAIPRAGRPGVPGPKAVEGQSEVEEQQVWAAYGALAPAGRLVYARTMERAARGDWDAAVAGYAADMACLAGRAPGSERVGRLRSAAPDVPRFQACLLEFLAEAKFLG